MMIRSHTFTTSASPDYGSGDAVGTPKEFPNFFNLPDRAVEIHTITAKDKAGQAPVLTLYFFKTDALTGTYTDNSAVVISEQDFNRCVGIAKVASADWATNGGRSIATVKPEIIVGLESSDHESLFVAVVAGGAYNAATTSDLTIHIAQEVD
jgi:hypothetical protein